jgi:hypothetical protein
MHTYIYVYTLSPSRQTPRAVSSIRRREREIFEAAKVLNPAPSRVPQISPLRPTRFGFRLHECVDTTNGVNVYWADVPVPEADTVCLTSHR